LGGGCGLVGASSLARQSQTGGVNKVLLDVEQVGRMVGTQMSFGVGDQGFGLVAGDLDDGHRPARQPFVQAAVPGLGVALRSILFQQKEIRDGLDGHQADLRMKGFVLAEANFAVGHLHGQTLVFLAAELGQERFHLGQVLGELIGAGPEPLPRADHAHHRLFVGNDTLDGQAGDDLIIGDYGKLEAYAILNATVIVLPILTRLSHVSKKMGIAILPSLFRISGSAPLPFRLPLIN